MLKRMKKYLVLTSFLMASVGKCFIVKPPPLLKDVLYTGAKQSVDVMSGLNDESARVARVIFNLPGMAVVRFIHSQKEETPSLRDDSASLPVDLKGKIGLYQVNAAKCMDLLKIIAFRVRLTKLDLPAVMFFNGSSLSLPIERGDISLQPLFELIRGRVMCRVH